MLQLWIYTNSCPHYTKLIVIDINIITYLLNTVILMYFRTQTPQDPLTFLPAPVSKYAVTITQHVVMNKQTPNHLLQMAPRTNLFATPSLLVPRNPSPRVRVQQKTFGNNSKLHQIV